MPNTKPPIFDEDTFDKALSAAKKKARCDYAQFMGAGPQNAAEAAVVASRTAGLKMYLDMTYGKLRLDEMTLWMPHFDLWPKEYPIVTHSESRTMGAAILFAAMYDRPVHIAHVSTQEEILTIKAAKERGIKVTCEVAPHHLFLSSNDFPRISQNGKYPGRQEVRPRLSSPEDRDALWDNLDVIDCFATDHAPHTLEEKDSEPPPPGYPGLETALPLLLTAVNKGWLSLDEIVTRMVENPRRIFNLPVQPETWVELDLQEEYTIDTQHLFTRCGWTPFDGRKVQGRILRVVLRGETVFEHGEVFASPGSGVDVRLHQLYA
jgi:carbamoyl-phosphate synthase/aspartate carbamoyltransferase/dihydroorotase